MPGPDTIGLAWKLYITASKTRLEVPSRVKNKRLRSNYLSIDRTVWGTVNTNTQRTSKLLSNHVIVVSPRIRTVVRTGAQTNLFMRRNLRIHNALPVLTRSLCFQNKKNCISPSGQLDAITAKYILGQTFIFKNIGFFLLNNLNNIYKHPSPLKFKIKKKTILIFSPQRG